MLIIIAILLALILFVMAPDLVAWLLGAGLAVVAIAIAGVVALLLLKNATWGGVEAVAAVVTAIVPAIMAARVLSTQWPRAWRLVLRGMLLCVGAALLLAGVALGALAAFVIYNEGISPAVIMFFPASMLCMGGVAALRGAFVGEDPATSTPDFAWKAEDRSPRSATSAVKVTTSPL